MSGVDAAWAEIPIALRMVYGFVFGALNGWFAGVVIERVPKGIGVSGLGDSPRSMCVCGRLLPMRQNIPVVSYLRLRGRARCCDARIPPWYLWVEVGMGAWWALAAGLPWLLGTVLLVVAGFTCLIVAGIARQRR